VALTPGTVVADRYRLERRLGKGSFAETFLARDEVGGRAVAVKVLDSSRVADLKSLELFEREAGVLRSLRHQAIPEVIDVVRATVDGHSAQCLVMEYLEGESLASVIDSGRRLDRPTVMRLFTDLIGVLDYLHTRLPPVLHRDLKPANIIVRPDGSPALVDFGSVKAVLQPGEGSTVAGTYGYMAYEQYMGQASPASDLFGLAATFLHLITGTPPSGFMRETGRIEVPAGLPCGEPLASVLSRLLRPAPNERYQTAAQVREAVFGGPGTAVAPVSPAGLARTPVALPEGPRRLTGPTRDLYRKLAPSTWRFLNADQKPAQVDAGSVLLVGLFSVLTMGVLPLWFWSLAGSRRRRVRPFLERGVLVPGTVLGMESVDVGFQVKMARVRYQFQTEQGLIRSSDQVLPNIAERWQEGDSIEVLYLPDRDHDSIIASIT
jgi:serine/threonine protein kinase